MATRNSLVFAAKIFDYLEMREQELDKIYVDLWAKGETTDYKSGGISGAINEICKLREWLQEH